MGSNDLDQVSLKALLRIFWDRGIVVKITPVKKKQYEELEVVEIRELGEESHLLYELSSQLVLTVRSPKWEQLFKDIKNENEVRRPSGNSPLRFIP